MRGCGARAGGVKRGRGIDLRTCAVKTLENLGFFPNMTLMKLLYSSSIR